MNPEHALDPYGSSDRAKRAVSHASGQESTPSKASGEGSMQTALGGAPKAPTTGLVAKSVSTPVMSKKGK